MDRPQQRNPPRRPRQQLSCRQCRSRKVRCDHERPCKRCRVRGWDAQCSYPLHDSPDPAYSGPAGTSSSGDGRARDWHGASPSTIPDPAPHIASAHNSPLAPSEIATPSSSSGQPEAGYGFFPRRSSPFPAPQKCPLSEPTSLGTPASASPQTLHRTISIAEQDAQTPPDSNRTTTSAVNFAYEPKTASDHALYLANGETVYFGRSSAPWLISKFSNIMSYIHSDLAGWTTSESSSVIRIKRLTSQQLMLAHDPEELPATGLYSVVPAKDITDRCVSKYFQSIDRIYPLFDAMKFRQEYEAFWRAPNQATLVFVVILLLVIGAGNCTIPEETRPVPRPTVIRWWRLGLTWQSAAVETNERMISTIQGSFLVVLLRQMYSLSETTEWISSGALVKNALAMGLHRDPAKLYGVPTDEHELRRRLFYTVLELDLQLCLNAGMQPTLRIGEWDTAPPDAFRDNRACCAAGSVPFHPPGTRSIQERMLGSLETRMKIACSVNAIMPRDDYDDVLDLSAQLSKSFQGLDKEPESCQTQVLGFLYNRYLLTLHVPFAIDGNPKFAYSQNVSLTSALSILEQISPVLGAADQEQHPEFRQLQEQSAATSSNADHSCTTAMHASGILFRNGSFYAALYLCHELTRDESSISTQTTPPPFAGVSLSSSSSSSKADYNLLSPLANPPPSTAASTSHDRSPNLVRALPDVEARVLSLVERFVRAAEERLRTTQFAGKAFLIPRMVLAHHRICADPEVRTRAEKERRLVEAGRVIAEICFSIFCSNPDVAKVL